MGRLCEACQHPRRNDIDAALLRHVASYENIAACFGLSFSGVRRHERKHLAIGFRQSQELQAMLSAQKLTEELGKWHTRMQRQYRNADQSGQIMAAVATARVGIQAIESFARITMDQEIERKLAEIEKRLNATEGGASNLIR